MPIGQGLTMNNFVNPKIFLKRELRWIPIEMKIRNEPTVGLPVDKMTLYA